MEEGRTYLSYLLRLWQTRRDGRAEWWASLESPEEERHCFTSLEEMFEFVKRRIEIQNQEEKGDQK